MERKKLLIACGIIVVLAGIVITVAVVAANQASNNSAAQNGNKTAAPIKVTGHFACLKHKNAKEGEPQTLECAIGLQAENGRYYALKNLPDSATGVEFSSTVQITGDLTQPANDDKYDTDGTITVATFTTDVIVR